jgi:acetolactate synthase-1/2/3 large subunit
MTNPDFGLLAQSMGAKSLRCKTMEELPAMMKEFLEYDGTRPILMECLVSSEHVYPMVPAGKALHEQIVSVAAGSKSFNTY